MTFSYFYFTEHGNVGRIFFFFFVLHICVKVKMGETISNQFTPIFVLFVVHISRKCDSNQNIGNWEINRVEQTYQHWYKVNKEFN